MSDEPNDMNEGRDFTIDTVVVRTDTAFVRLDKSLKIFHVIAHPDCNVEVTNAKSVYAGNNPNA